MTIDLENLALLPQILGELKALKRHIEDVTSQRWMTLKQTAHYLGYSPDRLYKLKDEHFIEGEHFYKRSGKILFDRVAIDDWVKGHNTHEPRKSKRDLVDRLLSSI